MTISSQTSRVSYTGNGSSVQFTIPFTFFQDADVVVYVDDVLQSDGSDYTVDGTEVEFATAPGSGVAIVIYRDPPLTQDTDYSDNDAFPASATEDALDKAVMIDQRTRNLLTRAVRLQDSDATVDMTLPLMADRANELLAFDSNGAPTTASVSELVPIIVTSSAVLFPTTIALASATVSALIGVVEVQGYSAVGDGGGARYKRSASQPMHSMWVQSVDGAYWVPMPDQSGSISVRVAGATGNGVTDDYTAIQKLIDAHTYFRICDVVFFPAGDYRTSNTLQCGYGGGSLVQPFTSTHLRGPGGADIAGDATDAYIDPIFSDRPAINIQGQRFFTMYGLVLFGKLYNFINSNSLGNNPSVDDSDPDKWNDPGLAANASSRTAPYAGIAVDGLSGDAPVTAYPALPTPAFLGTITPYNRFFSSKIAIDQSQLVGFDTAYVVHPGNGAGNDGNGDFHDLTNCQIQYCKWGISVGNTQCRQVNRINCEFNTLYCAETTSTHGDQNGKMEGISLGCAVGQVINLHIFGNDLSIAGPIKYEKLYGESVWQLGRVANGTAIASSIEYSGCNIAFYLQDTASVRGIPVFMLRASLNSNRINVIFTGGTFFSYLSVFAMWLGTDGLSTQNNITIDGTNFFAANFGIKDTLWERAAQNVLAGGLAFFPVPEVKNGAMKITARIYNLSLVPAGEEGTTTNIGPMLQLSRRRSPVSAYAKYSTGPNNWQDAQAPVPAVWGTFEKSLTSARSLVNRTLTFTYAASAYDSMRFGPRIGDVLIDQDSGSVFYVSNKVGNVITAELQNNFRDNGAGGFETINAVSLSTGEDWQVINSRIYTPANYLIGDMTSGSANVANAGTPAGDTGPMTSSSTGIVNGDWYLVTDDSYSFPFPTTDTTVSALAGGSFTLGSNARYTEARHAFKFFIKPAP